MQILAYVDPTKIMISILQRGAARCQRSLLEALEGTESDTSLRDRTIGAQDQAQGSTRHTALLRIPQDGNEETRKAVFRQILARPRKAMTLAFRSRNRAPSAVVDGRGPTPDKESRDWLTDLSGNPQSVEAFKNVLDILNSKHRVRKAISAMRTHSLVTSLSDEVPDKEESSTVLWMHDLVQWLLRRKASAYSTGCKLGLQMTAWLLAESWDALGDYANAQIWRQFRDMIPHISTTEKYVDEDRSLSPYFPRIIKEMGIFLLNAGSYREALPVLTRALAKQRKALGLGHIDTLQTASAVGHCFHRCGLYSDAEQVAREAIAAGEGQGAKASRFVLDCNSIVTKVCLETDRLDEAKKIATSSFEMARNTYGEGNAVTLSLRGDLIRILGEQDKWEEAERMARSGLTIARDTFGWDDLRTLDWEYNVIWTLANLDRSDIAELAAQAQVLLERMKHVIGEEHPDTVATLELLAQLHKHQGHLADAIEEITEVSQLKTKIFGADHLYTLRAVETVHHWQQLSTRPTAEAELEFES